MKNHAIVAPDWLSRSSIYQINPRTFGPEGTVASIIPELPKLKELGFGVMYLCPIFEADDSEDKAFWSARQKKYGTENPKNPYRMNTYFEIDQEYGTMADLKQFVAECHKLGLKVLLDLVYAHIGPNAPILQRHPEFAYQNEDGSIRLSSWNFPLLDYNNPGLREYLWCNMVYYVGEFDVDGYRCDVGDMVPIDFWAEGRRRIQTIKPDAVLFNEGDNWSYMLRGFDTSYCWYWHDKLYSLFLGEATAYTEATTAADLRAFWEKTNGDLPKGALLARDIDNHDTVTDLARTEVIAGHDGMELIEVINYLIDGIPMVYSGNELADTARVNMFANRFHMGVYEVTDRNKVTPESLRRQEIIKKLNALKRESDILRYGETQWLDTAEPEKVVAFARNWDGHSITLVGNASKEAVTLELNTSGEILMINQASVNGNTVTLESHGYVVIQK